MSIRAGLVCVAIIVLAGCNTREVVNTVQHRSAWQRQAGESPQEAARLVKQSEKNTEELLTAIQKGEISELDEKMRGKLVKLEGEVFEQSDKSWTIRNKDGWTILAPVNDLTPHNEAPKERIRTCIALGTVQFVDAQNRKIMLADVELTPDMKPAM